MSKIDSQAQAHPSKQYAYKCWNLHIHDHIVRNVSFQINLTTDHDELMIAA